MNYPKVNAHLHTPYSFSAFRDIDDALDRAATENVKVVGINDPANPGHIYLSGKGLAYPFLGDDAQGDYTDFEKDLECVAEELTKRGFHSVEFITTRNRVDLLEKYAAHQHVVAQRLEGANIVVADLNEEKGLSTTEYFNSLLKGKGNHALFVKTDVAEIPSLENLIYETICHFGGIDCFISNAGVLRAGGGWTKWIRKFPEERN